MLFGGFLILIFSVLAFIFVVGAVISIEENSDGFGGFFLVLAMITVCLIVGGCLLKDEINSGRYIAYLEQREKLLKEMESLEPEFMDVYTEYLEKTNKNIEFYEKNMTVDQVRAYKRKINGQNSD